MPNAALNLTRPPNTRAAARHIELDEPVPNLEGEVEVMLRPVVKPTGAAGADVFDLIANAAAGTRTKQEIDQQIAEERSSWGARCPAYISIPAALFKSTGC
ncbi:MAG: hypothetical protein IPK82_26525 [Polyangiaceae bacterium]|nr:hypothetical protein [Polyangiaceae bacterium]